MCISSGGEDGIERMGERGGSEYIGMGKCGEGRERGSGRGGGGREGGGGFTVMEDLPQLTLLGEMTAPHRKCIGTPRWGA